MDEQSKIFGYYDRVEDSMASASNAVQAAETILRMRQESPVPLDFDWEKAREEAVLEKYGHFIECFGSVTNLKHPQDRR